ncbi:hypothetical protein C9374_005605 [Naegleria lovaniensis]|uniref:Homeobox domain-containing protein n=1 Tax=Naegleria lovaniensis TaxID=51637 RepID=A0AA88GPY4_NAELO|nr:uncharacterized protein C9374_005605 [Naegleria lovaniensis]KAG2382403.1 hypothetical protein C9374_005605 [Naegleria lovaniensis]
MSRQELLNNHLFEMPLDSTNKQDRIQLPPISELFKIADQAENTASYLCPPTTISSPMNIYDFTIRKSKRRLHSVAVRTLMEWFISHLSYPYPTDDEKRQLSEETGLTLTQVNNWFVSKRTRCRTQLMSHRSESTAKSNRTDMTEASLSFP